MLAQIAQAAVVERAEVLVVHPHFAGSGLGDAGNQFEHGGFARAGMPGHENHLALADFEADVLQGVEAAGIGFGNLFETDHDVSLGVNGFQVAFRKTPFEAT